MNRWRELIKANANKVTVEMGVKYPTVYKYFNPSVMAIPDNRRDGMLKPLCRAMVRILTPEESIEFFNSLSEELTRDITEIASTVQNTGTEG